MLYRVRQRKECVIQSSSALGVCYTEFVSAGSVLYRVSQRKECVIQSSSAQGVCYTELVTVGSVLCRVRHCRQCVIQSSQYSFMLQFYWSFLFFAWLEGWRVLNYTGAFINRCLAGRLESSQLYWSFY